MIPVKIGVMGAGSVGCFVGGKLAAAGADVVFIGRERVKRELDEHGLVLEDLGRPTVTVDRARVVFDSDIGRLADRDIVLCCVKSAATADTATQLGGVMRPDTIVVSLQNGVRNPEELRSRMKQPVLAGIVNFNIISKGRGVFRRATTGPLIIEEHARLEQLAGPLSVAGFEVDRAREIREVMWSKLVINLNNSVSALSDRPTKEIVLSAGYRRVLSGLVGEALEVLRAAGIRPAKLGRIPIALFTAVLRLPTPIVRLVARAQLKIDPEARSSMWEDLTTGRPTEIDWINGEVVRLAESCGARAPLNARIVEMVHEAERAKAGSPKLSASALWSALNA